MLEILDDKKADAFQNMADDYLLLQQIPAIPKIIFRHYQWTHSAITFGYSQKFAEVIEIASDYPFQLCRRPTGGGIVNHTTDWTYSLVFSQPCIPQNKKTSSLYELVHNAIANTLRRFEQMVDLVPCNKSMCNTLANRPKATIATQCFTKPEVFDIVSRGTNTKIAGAAVKRNRKGLLFQGSIEKTHCPHVNDWGQFKNLFTEELAQMLNTPTQSAPFPKFPAIERESTLQLFRSKEWNQKR